MNRGRTFSNLLIFSAIVFFLPIAAKSDDLLDSTRVDAKLPTIPAIGINQSHGNLTIDHEDWLLPPFSWSLKNHETGEVITRNKTFDANDIPAGQYSLVWHQFEKGSTEITIFDNVAIVAGETTKLTLNTSIRLKVPTWVTPPRLWGLRNPNTQEDIVAFTAFERFIVPIGTYELIWRQYENRGDTMSFGLVQIESGKLNEVILGSSLAPIKASWVPEKIFYWGLKNSESGEWVSRYYGELQPQLVPPGHYLFYYRQAESDSNDSLLGEVSVVEDKESRFSIDTGVDFSFSSPENRPVRAAFTLLGDADKALYSFILTDVRYPIPLAAGHYKVEVTTAQDRSENSDSSTDEISLKSGELLQINLDDVLHPTKVISKDSDAKNEKESEFKSPTPRATLNLESEISELSPKSETIIKLQ